MFSPDPIVVSFTVFGAFVGVFFVIDGWRGSAKAGDLSNAPRMRALLWAIGFAVSTFVLDLKKIGISLPDDRSALFMAYLIGFAASTFSTLGLSVLVLALPSIWSALRRGRPSRGTDAPFPPILDYIHYGYRYFRDECATRDLAIRSGAESELERQRGLFARYADDMATAVMSVNRFLQTGGDGPSVARFIMHLLVSLMEKYLPGSKINASYMHAYKAEECPEPIRSKLRFAFSDPRHYSHFLSIIEYASDTDREGFALPVELDAARLLPGAPLAFRRNRMVYVEDTSAIKFPIGLNPGEVRQQSEYFSTKSFKSFLSVPIPNAEGEPVGVLNVDANRKFAFGQTEREAIANSTIVLPFCALLSAIITRGDKR